MTLANDAPEQQESWLERPVSSYIPFNWVYIVFIAIMILAFISRFYNLESRVMSHDENSHVYFSWLYQQGNGYSHDPVTHGPFQFHVVALSYLLFGDNDFTARIPAALFSIATIAFVWQYRRTLGQTAVIIASILLLISPFMLYYGRYVRNEAFVAFFGIVSLWAVIRYLESGSTPYLFWLTAATSLHFATKETSYIYHAVLLIFLAFYLIFRISNKSWQITSFRYIFLISLILALLLLGAGGLMMTLGNGAGAPSSTETVAPAVPGQEALIPSISAVSPITLILFSLGFICLIVAIYFLLRGYTFTQLRHERAFDMLILMGTLVLPLLAAFPVKLFGINPIDYQNNRTIIADGIFIGLFALIAVGIGLWWRPRAWLINAAIFYGIFIVFYTSLFTNGFGIFTGLVGSLGYWLEQQGVNRGSQPWYYYGLVQLPFYEFLPYLLTICATFLAPLFLRLKSKSSDVESSPMDVVSVDEQAETEISSDRPMEGTAIALLLYWSYASLLAYSIAGEKMPWLTVHITWPMILVSGWLIGKIIDTTDWSAFRRNKGILIILLVPVFLLSVFAIFGALLGTNPPFQGKELNQLQATSTFIFALIAAILSGWGIYRLARSWSPGQLMRILTLTVIGFLGILTARSAILASYIYYDYANELLVYAHSAPGDKLALAQIEEISRRTTDGLSMQVAYDSETSYPFWWYLRDYPNKIAFGNEPTRSLRDAVAILAGDANFDKLEPIVGQAYHRFDYIRLWWPNQDYFNLTPQRILGALRNPQMREALFRIWLNHDYTLYGQVTGKDLSFPNWNPAERMRLYIRKDAIASLWNYGVSPSPEEIIADPYEGKQVNMIADNIIGVLGSEPGQFKRQRDLAVSPDGSLYVADTENHRIQHLSPDGNVLHSWGGFAAGTEASPAPNGTFNEPWGIAVGPDGSVYVADTWNHRIQKFDAEGNFITTWGYGISQTDDPFGFYGPRDVDVDQEGHVYVTDTGNKRIVVFTSDGEFLTTFGSAGFSPGEFDEPVGVSVDNQGRVYVADTWNQRIQVFMQNEDGSYSPINTWDIAAWYGQSLDNKPYIDADNSTNLFVADPEGVRILQFTTDGNFVQYWGDYSSGVDGFGLVGSVQADNNGGVWVSDTNNNRLMHFTLNTASSPAKAP